MNKKSFLEELGKAFVPKKFRPGLRFYLSKTGIQEVPYMFFGIMFYVVIALTAVVYFATNFFGIVRDSSALLVGLYVFLFWSICSILLAIVIMAGIYFYFNMRIYNRVKEIELNLADYLVLVSTNLKGGLSFEKALWNSIKPEFGILSEEMSLVSKRVMTGSDLSDALKEFGEKYDSPTMKRTINLIIGELESGGEVARVLDQTIETLRKTRLIKDEMTANTLMFTIFIGAIVVVISPLLFALAFNLLSILISVTGQIAPALSQSSATNLPFKFNAVTLDKDDFKLFSVFALTIIAVFSSMILSIIQKGDIKGGLKYTPFFVASALLLYFFFLFMLGGMFEFF